MNLSSNALTAIAAAATVVVTVLLNLERVTRRTRAIRQIDRLVQICSKLPPHMADVQQLVEIEIRRRSVALRPLGPRPVALDWFAGVAGLGMWVFAALVAVSKPMTAVSVALAVSLLVFGGWTMNRVASIITRWRRPNG